MHNKQVNRKVGKHMIYAQIENRKNGFTHIDGYSKAKTVNGALKDLARYVLKYNEGEAKFIIDGIANKENPLINSEYYILECEEVGCASRINEETDEMEYKEGNFYLHLMYVTN